MEPVTSQSSPLSPKDFGTAAAGGQVAQTTSNTLSADFETFLRLLTTQMKNQDPTNPQDSTEFISHIAAAEFDGDPVEISFTPPQDAQTAYVSVKDESNVEIAKIAVAPNDVSTTWNGTDFTGATAPEGAYSFAIVGVAEGTVISTQAAQTYSRVTEARSENGEIVLIFADGTRMRANDVDFARTALSET